MGRNKKLQVFVSSTFKDLKEERQAAVEAILTAGHIPAGMELFTAGDETQMHVIKRWIDEADVYMLILGGRYGSVEPVSGKSYTQLEYEYALAKGKPLFSVVVNDSHLDEKVKSVGRSVLEEENPGRLKEFRKLVETKMVRYWSDPRDIKLAIHETMAEFSHREELVGWIPASEGVDGGALAEEMARLTKENSELRQELHTLKESTQDIILEFFYNMVPIYENTIIDVPYRDSQSYIAIEGGEKPKDAWLQFDIYNKSSHSVFSGDIDISLIIEGHNGELRGLKLPDGKTHNSMHTTGKIFPGGWGSAAGQLTGKFNSMVNVPVTLQCLTSNSRQDIRLYLAFHRASD